MNWVIVGSVTVYHYFGVGWHHSVYGTLRKCNWKFDVNIINSQRKNMSERGVCHERPNFCHEYRKESLRSYDQALEGSMCGNSEQPDQIVLTLNCIISLVVFACSQYLEWERVSTFICVYQNIYICSYHSVVDHAYSLKCVLNISVNKACAYEAWSMQGYCWYACYFFLIHVLENIQK